MWCSTSPPAEAPAPASAPGARALGSGGVGTEDPAWRDYELYDVFPIRPGARGDDSLRRRSSGKIDIVQTGDRSGWQGLPEWRGETGRRWAAASGTADVQFGRLSEAGYRRLGEIAGLRVLDVGCGSGGTTAELASLVGPTGTVTGIDPSPEVLVHARRSCAGLPVQLIEGDAATHRFDSAAFDVVFSRLGVMFFEDPTAAFANLRRVTVAGGRLSFSCWPPREEVPLLVRPLRALAGLVELPASAPAGSPNPFSLGDRAATAALLERAGWQEVTVEELRWTVSLPDDVRDAAERWLTTIPVTLSVQHPEPGLRERLLDALAAAVPAERRLEQVALLVSARA